MVLLSLSLKWDNVRKELEGFAAIASSCKGGRITINEFATFLKIPVNPLLKELFALFDRVSTQKSNTWSPHCFLFYQLTSDH